MPGLDGVRGIAIALVLGCHASVWFMLGGGIGVDIFFVLSGFLITRVIRTELRRTGRLDFVRFYWHRFLRIVPPLVGVCAGLLCIAPFIGIPFQAVTNDFAVTLTFISDYTRSRGGVPVYLVPTWSLSVEEQFYLLWPIVALGLFKHVRTERHIASGLICFAFGIGLWRYYRFETASNTMAVYDSFDARCDALCFGSTLAFFEEKQLREVGRFWPAGLSILAWFVYGSDWSKPFMYSGGFTLVGLSSATFIAAAACRSSSVLSFVLESTPARQLGRISYSLYLWHWLPLIIMWSAGVRGSTLLWMIPIGIFFAALSTRFIERPAARLREIKSQPLQLTASLAVPILFVSGLIFVLPYVGVHTSSEKIYSERFKGAAPVTLGTVIQQSFHSTLDDIQSVTVVVVTWAKAPSSYALHWSVTGKTAGSVVGEGSSATQNMSDWQALVLPIRASAGEKDFEVTFSAEAGGVKLINPIGLAFFEAAPDGEPPGKIDAVSRSDGAVVGLTINSRK